MVPPPKLIWIRGTRRTLSHAASKFWLMNRATSSFENNTVLAKRALVQQNCSSSLPIIWNSKTGLPETCEALQAAAKLGCQTTRPGAILGLSNGSAAGAAPDRAASTSLVGRSMTYLLGASPIAGGAVSTAKARAVSILCVRKNLRSFMEILLGFPPG